MPVVNLLSDRAHPCPGTGRPADPAPGLRADVARSHAWPIVGDANNVWRSLALACAMAGMPTRVASPAGYGPAPADVERVRRLGGELLVTDDPPEAAAGADVLYTDVWTSMGQEDEAERATAGLRRLHRRRGAAGRGRARGRRARTACPPTAARRSPPTVIDGPRSVVWQQAANRMHVMRGVLAW